MLDERRIEEIMARKREARIKEIESLRTRARRRGESDDPGLWALVHDLERATPTTNLSQLAEIGVEVPNEEALEDDEVEESLEAIIGGLSLLDVFLRHTDHLDDRSLHRVLRDRILLEPVRDLPAGIGSREWIDLTGGVDRSAYLAVHAGKEVRRAAAEAGEWLPRRLRRLADRDRHLPRPSSGS
ncbi:MAG: hypothetical protein GY895_20065 [Phycisphaera sp.]|nr:hypothetical protein [Phycisphaera sp.]